MPLATGACGRVAALHLDLSRIVRLHPRPLRRLVMYRGSRCRRGSGRSCIRGGGGGERRERDRRQDVLIHDRGLRFPWRGLRGRGRMDDAARDDRVFLSNDAQCIGPGCQVLSRSNGRVRMPPAAAVLEDPDAVLRDVVAPCVRKVVGDLRDELRKKLAPLAVPRHKLRRQRRLAIRIGAALPHLPDPPRHIGSGGKFARAAPAQDVLPAAAAPNSTPVLTAAALHTAPTEARKGPGASLGEVRVAVAAARQQALRQITCATAHPRPRRDQLASLGQALLGGAERASCRLGTACSMLVSLNTGRRPEGICISCSLQIRRLPPC
eukprot:scaffold5810_cov112-Isochrysis_galbana.AAC.7